MLLTDDRAMVGSCNFDRWSQRWNLEANQAVDDPAFAQELADLFAADFTDSQEISRQQWQQRPWRARVHERFWSLLELWALRLTRRSSLMLGRHRRRT
jgi:phosphatidylserine/phosphatidylglycerophosphate/cardiolipin synthase-like enzyme